MNIQNDDEGEYTCVADNNKVANDFDFDVVSSSTTVKVTSKGNANFPGIHYIYVIYKVQILEIYSLFCVHKKLDVTVALTANSNVIIF